MKSIKTIVVSIIALTMMISCSKEDESTDSTPKTPAGCFDQTEYTKQLPNMNFEDWGYPDSSYNKYQEPCGGIWTSFNAFGVDFDIIGTTPTTTAQNGSRALQMKSSQLILLTAPGIIFTGRIKDYSLNIQDPLSNAELGVPFTEKPKTLEGFHRYTSVQGDSAYAAVLLTKFDMANNKRDTVGFGELTFLKTTATYEPFSLPISYTFDKGSEAPDSVTVFFTSSKAYASLEGGVGSTLLIDNCSFGY